MSLKHIQKILEDFISKDRNDLLVLKGGWGVGKTHLWQTIVKKAKKENNTGKKRYSYISLFGINNLEDLKNIIIATREAAGQFDDFRDITKLSVFIMKWSSRFEKVPHFNEYTKGIISNFLFLSLRDTLICFDDIERRGNGLDIRDIMGLASLLKEQRNCQIVFILNESILLEEASRDFEKHSEKIIDIQVELVPNSDEIFDYVFDKSNPYYDIIKQDAIILNIKNIRILQRINRFTDDIILKLKNSEPEVILYCIHHIILYVASYYTKDETIPPIDYIKKYTYTQLFLNKDKKEDNVEWKSILQKYRYQSTNDFDIILISFIEKGYVDEEEFFTEISKMNQKYISEFSQNIYREAWNIYSNSFNDNEEEFINKLSKEFIFHLPNMTLSHLQASVSIFRELNYEDVADNIISEFFKYHSEDIAAIDRSHITFTRTVYDPKIVSYLQDIWQLTRINLTLKEAVHLFSFKDGWNDEEMSVLLSAEIEDFYKLFKNENSENLYFYIKGCLRFLEFSDDSYRQIGLKAKAAIQKIAAESRINRIRIANLYNINIIDE
jgi:hypothetical protein